MTVPIKEQRNLAKILLGKDMHVFNMVEQITKTGSTNGRIILTWLRDKLQGIDPNIPKPTLAQWESALELSEVFKITERKKNSAMRPVVDYSSSICGALTIYKPTGYVDLKKGSPLWLCECDFCERQLTLSSHDLNYLLPYCQTGRGTCPDGYATAKEHRKNKNPIYPIHVPVPDADILIDAIAPHRPMSTEIH